VLRVGVGVGVDNLRTISNRVDHAEVDCQVPCRVKIYKWQLKSKPAEISAETGPRRKARGTSRTASLVMQTYLSSQTVLRSFCRQCKD
jgi:hypothetical protein